MIDIEQLLEEIDEIHGDPIQIMVISHGLNQHFGYCMPNLLFNEKGERTDEVNRINALICDSKYSDYKNLKKFGELWDFFRSFKQEDRANQERVFGKKFIDESRGNIMGTLTPYSREFRVWNGIPAYISREHVDSCGQNLIFEAYGERRHLQPVAEVIFPEKKKYQPLMLPNGVTLYMEYHPK